MQAEASNVVNALRFEKAPKYSLLGELLPPSIILSCEPVSKVTLCKVEQSLYLQPIITQYFIDNKSEIWLLFLIAHSKR